MIFEEFETKIYIYTFIMSIVKVQQHNQYLVKKCEIFFIKTPYFIYNGEKQRFFLELLKWKQMMKLIG